MPRHITVGPLDVAAASDPVWVVVGPVSGDAAIRFRDVLARMAAHGPTFRVGLLPDPTSNSWRFTSRPGGDLGIDLDAADTPEAILDRVVGHQPSTAIAVGNAGEYLCVCLDHGIGDSHVMMEMVAGIASPGAPEGFIEPVPNPNVNRPLRDALATHVRTNAHRGATIAKAVGATAVSVFGRARTMLAGNDVTASSIKVSGYEAVFVKSPCDFVSRVRSWRDACHPGASVTSMIILAIHRALRDSGIPVADDVEVLVDLRRFLRPGSQTLGNMYAVTEVNAAPEVSFLEFSREFREQTTSNWPLVKTAVLQALGRVMLCLGRRKPPAWWVDGTEVDPAGGRVQLTVSDISKMPSTAKLAFSRPAEGVLAVALPPGTPRSVTLAIWVSSVGEVQVTATLSGEVVDRERVRSALANALSVDAFSFEGWGEVTSA